MVDKVEWHLSEVYHTLYHNIASIMRTLVLPKDNEALVLDDTEEVWVKIGAQAANQQRYVTFQLAEVVTT